MFNADIRRLTMANRHQGWERIEGARVEAWDRNEGADRRYARLIHRKQEKGMKVEKEGVRFEYADRRRGYKYTDLSRNVSCKLFAITDFDTYDTFAAIFMNSVHEVVTHYGKWVLDGHGYAVYYSHQNELMVCGHGTNRHGVPAVLADKAFAWRLFQEALGHMDDNGGELAKGWCYSLRDNVAA